MKATDLLEIKAAIRLLKTSRPTFYRWLRAGRLKGVKVGRQWRFARADLERFVQGEPPRLEARGPLEPLLEALGVTAAGGAADGALEPLAIAARAVVDHACARGASDVHLMPRREPSGLVVAELAHRVAPALERVVTFDARLLDGLIDQFKVLSRCDLHVRARPQQGRIDAWPAGGRRVDLNLCFVPTPLGEALTIRIQDPRAVRITLDELPFSAPDRERLRAAVRQPHGLVLVTGPTGSGKTTTLYALAQERLAAGVKVMTVESPVTLLLDGAVQVSADPVAGVTAAAALRAVLASDADVIVITELGHAEVAALAVEAAATGHLVIGQMRCADAVGAVERLAELGVERTALADVLRAVTSQRLVRLLCGACKEPHKLDKRESERLAGLVRAGGVAGRRPPGAYSRAVGCAECEHRGFKGRTMVSEVLELGPALIRAVRSGMDARNLRDLAAQAGMPTLQADAIVKAALGVTTLDEVFRVVGGR